MKKNVGALGISLIGGGALLAYSLWRWKAGKNDKAFRGKWPLPEGARLVKTGEKTRDVVDQAALESFPASDPPSFSPVQVG